MAFKVNKPPKPFTIERWLGLNESPDGDVNLKPGEASMMKNWRITGDGNLTVRPGYHAFAGTYENLITNSNFADGTTGWVDGSGVSPAGISATDGILKFVGDGTATFGDVLQTTSSAAVSGDKYYARVKCRCVQGGATKLTLRLSSVGDATTALIDSIASPSAGTWYTLSGVTTVRATDSGFVRLVVRQEWSSAATELNKEVEIDGNYGVLYVNPTSAFGAGSEPNKAWCDAHIVYNGDYIGGVPTGNPVRAMWSGYVGGDLYHLAVCDGTVFDMTDPTDVTTIGTITDDETTIFGFGNKVYFLNGHEYYEWDGTTFQEVAGYVPIITTATPPAGGGTILESQNLLSDSKRQLFTPEATSSTVFTLRDQDIASVDWVKDGGVTVDSGDYTVDLTNGTVTYTPDTTNANSVEIQWTKSENTRVFIEGQYFAEIFGGINDSRVFVYGDGSNKVYYSGLDTYGAYRADYFPADGEMAIGAENTPVTSVTKQYDRLLVLKTDSAWHIEAIGVMTGDTGNIVVGYTVLPLNDVIGSETLGHSVLIENNPMTLCKGAVYEWRSTQIRDERMAKRISDRAQKTLSGFDLSACKSFENNRDLEHWIVHSSDVLVHNYQSDTWYTYTNMPITSFVEHDGGVYIGLSDGSVYAYSPTYRADAGTAIYALWRGGNFSFGADYLKKTINRVFITMKPDSHAKVAFSVLTNNKSSAPQQKEISYNLATFAHCDFGNYSFRTSRRPQTKKVRMKLNNFSFFTPMLESNSDVNTATILNMSIPVQYGGETKQR